MFRHQGLLTAGSFDVLASVNKGGTGGDLLGDALVKDVSG